jgi:hypothetical protein
MCYLARKAYRVSVGDKLMIDGEVAEVTENTYMSEGWHLITHKCQTYPNGVTKAYTRNQSIPVA